MQIVMPIFALTLPEDAGEGALAMPHGRPEGQGSFLSVMAEGAALPSMSATPGDGEGGLAEDLPAMGVLLPLVRDLATLTSSAGMAGFVTPEADQHIVISEEKNLPVLPLSDDIQSDNAGGISGTAKSAPVVAEGAAHPEDKGASEPPHTVLVNQPLFATGSLPPAGPDSGHIGQGEPWQAEGAIAAAPESPETESDSPKQASSFKTIMLSSATAVSAHDTASAWVTVPSREDTMAPSEPALPQATSTPVRREALMPGQTTTPSALGTPRDILPIATPAPQMPQDATGFAEPQAPGRGRGSPAPAMSVDAVPDPKPISAAPVPPQVTNTSTIHAPLRLASAGAEQMVSSPDRAPQPEASARASQTPHGITDNGPVRGPIQERTLSVPSPSMEEPLPESAPQSAAMRPTQAPQEPSTRPPTRVASSEPDVPGTPSEKATLRRGPILASAPQTQPGAKPDASRLASVQERGGALPSVSFGEPPEPASQPAQASADQPPRPDRNGHDRPQFSPATPRAYLPAASAPAVSGPVITQPEATPAHPSTNLTQPSADPPAPISVAHPMSWASEPLPRRVFPPQAQALSVAQPRDGIPEKVMAPTTGGATGGLPLMSDPPKMTPLQPGHIVREQRLADPVPPPPAYPTPSASAQGQPVQPGSSQELPTAQALPSPPPPAPTVKGSKTADKEVPAWQLALPAAPMSAAPTGIAASPPLPALFMAPWQQAQSADRIHDETGDIDLAPLELKGFDLAVARSNSPHIQADLPRHMAQQVAEVARMLPDRPVELTLSPEELGRLRLTFTAEGGAMAVAVSAERPETMDLLRRHIDTLAQELRDIGYTDVSFDFAQQGDGSDSASEEPTWTGERTEADMIDLAPGDTSQPRPAHLDLTTPGGIDIRM